MDKLLTIGEVSAVTRQPVETLRFWRQQGRGPEGHKIGRRLLYRESDVQTWLDEAMGLNDGGRSTRSE